MKAFLALVCLFIGLSCTEKPRSNIGRYPDLKLSDGPLLGTRMSSFNILKDWLHFSYPSDSSYVVVTQRTNDTILQSVLKSGVDEYDFDKAWKGGVLAKLGLALRCPYLLIARRDMIKAYLLSRRRGEYFGEGDISFYDIAEAMMDNMVRNDLDSSYVNDFCDKGFINTYNHVNAQAFITSLFSEKLADFIADTHERARIPELVTGRLTQKQILDTDNGAVDNYVDMINNEWGQEIGKRLKQKYDIDDQTFWSPKLLVNYLNDLQSFYAWVYKVRFRPFREDEVLVQNFFNKLNQMREKVSLNPS